MNCGKNLRLQVTFTITKISIVFTSVQKHLPGKNAKFTHGYGITFSHSRRITGTIGNVLVHGNDATKPFTSVGLRTDEFILINSFSPRMQLHTPTSFRVGDRIS